MKTYPVNFTFVFPSVSFGTMNHGNSSIKGLFYNGQITRVVESKIHLTKLPKTSDYVTLISDEQVIKLLEEGEGENFFDTEDKIRDAFSFYVKIHRGRNREGCYFWVEFINEQLTESSYSDADTLDKQNFVIMQLIRFGIVERLRVMK